MTEEVKKKSKSLTFSYNVVLSWFPENPNLIEQTTQTDHNSEDVVSPVVL